MRNAKCVLQLSLLTRFDSGCIITVQSATSMTITLPSASGNPFVGYIFIRTTDTTASVIIQTVDSETITVVDIDNGLLDAQTSITSGAGAAFKNSTVGLFSTGTEWVGQGLSKGWL